ncbi:hypothetical protein C0J52_26758 [Blattella germanica]|nr:hypothetical protein C0J52_26758 [Blattella germanica]
MKTLICVVLFASVFISLGAAEEKKVNKRGLFGLGYGYGLGYGDYYGPGVPYTKPLIGFGYNNGFHGYGYIPGAGLVHGLGYGRYSRLYPSYAYPGLSDYGHGYY